MTKLANHFSLVYLGLFLDTDDVSYIKLTRRGLNMNAYYRSDGGYCLSGFKNRKKIGNCVPRAIAIALRKPYIDWLKVIKDINHGRTINKDVMEHSHPDLIKLIEDKLERHNNYAIDEIEYSISKIVFHFIFTNIKNG